ncbi:hypothetical protein ACFE04_021778 [Oxalis oulophora]
MRIEDGSEPQSASTNHLIFTGHGFGHATRVVEVVRNLILVGHDVHVVTAAPDFVFTSEVQSPRLFIRKVLLDCGAVQADALTVDRLASFDNPWNILAHVDTEVYDSPCSGVTRCKVLEQYQVYADSILGRYGKDRPNVRDLSKWLLAFILIAIFRQLQRQYIDRKSEGSSGRFRSALTGHNHSRVEPSLEPHVRFVYPPEKELPLQYKDLLSFCFPGDLEVHAVEITPSMSELNEMLLAQTKSGAWILLTAT